MLRHGRLAADVSRLEVHPDDVAALVAGVRTDTSARQQLRRLRSLVDQLADADPSVVLPLTVSAMADALGVEMVCVYLLDRSDPDAPVLVRSAAGGVPPALLDVNAVLPFGQAGGSSGQAARGRRGRGRGPARRPAWEPDARRGRRRAGTQHLGGADLGVDGLLGVVSAYATTPGRPQAEQLELVALFASRRPRRWTAAACSPR